MRRNLIRSLVPVALACLANNVWAQTPSAADVFKRYVTASGGESAIRAITSRALTGQVKAPGGTAPLEIIEASANRFLRIIDSPVSGRSENGYDGTNAWSADKSGVRDLSGPPVGMVLRELHLYRPAAMRGFYPTVGTPRADTLEGKPVFALAVTSSDGMNETLYFDRATGLLSGWDVVIMETTVKNRLDDYRSVDGIMIPFRVRRSRPDFAWSEEFTVITHNVVVDTTRFLRPKSF